MAVLTHDGTTVYGERRQRARELGARFDFAQDPLRLYLALVDSQERTFERAQKDRPSADELAAYIVRVALPGVMDEHDVDLARAHKPEHRAQRCYDAGVIVQVGDAKQVLERVGDNEHGVYRRQLFLEPEQGLIGPVPREHVELVVLPRAGHLSSLEQPAAFNEALAAFLTHRV